MWMDYNRTHMSNFDIETPRLKWRTRLIWIILLTIPCYCLGFILFSLAPDPVTGTVTPTMTITGTPPTATVSSTSYVYTPYDRIPNFGANPTIVSIATGDWSNPNTWSNGRTPNRQGLENLG